MYLLLNGNKYFKIQIIILPPVNLIIFKFKVIMKLNVILACFNCRDPGLLSTTCCLKTDHGITESQTMSRCVCLSINIDDY